MLVRDTFYSRTRDRLSKAFFRQFLTSLLVVCIQLKCHGDTPPPKDQIIKRALQIINKLSYISAARQREHDGDPSLVVEKIIGAERNSDVLYKVAMMTAGLFHPGRAEDAGIDQYMEPLIWAALGRIAEQKDEDSKLLLDRFRQEVRMDGAWCLWFDDLLRRQGRPPYYTQRSSGPNDHSDR